MVSYFDFIAVISSRLNNTTSLRSYATLHLPFPRRRDGTYATLPLPYSPLLRSHSNSGDHCTIIGNINKAELLHCPHASTLWHVAFKVLLQFCHAATFTTRFSSSSSKDLESTHAWGNDALGSVLCAQAARSLITMPVVNSIKMASGGRRSAES